MHGHNCQTIFAIVHIARKSAHDSETVESFAIDDTPRFWPHSFGDVFHDF